MGRKKKEVLTVPNRKVLRLVLKTHNVTYSRWGRLATKTMTQLLGEIKTGESILVRRGKKIVRVVCQAQVRIYFEHKPGKWLFLYEQCQIFANGHRRVRKERTVSVSEKLRAGEDALAGVVRGLSEELGLTLLHTDGFELVGAWKFYKSASDSYPGLASEHRVTCYRLVLPIEHFNASGYAEHQKRKSTLFAWRKSRKGPNTKNPAR